MAAMELKDLYVSSRFPAGAGRRISMLVLGRRGEEVLKHRGPAGIAAELNSAGQALSNFHAEAIKHRRDGRMGAHVSSRA